MVLAATGYVLGATQSKEYAEPEWYVDWWLTVVWLAYLAVFLGTIIRRREPWRTADAAAVPRIAVTPPAVLQ